MPNRGWDLTGSRGGQCSSYLEGLVLSPMMHSFTHRYQVVSLQPLDLFINTFKLFIYLSLGFTFSSVVNRYHIGAIGRIHLSYEALDPGLTGDRLISQPRVAKHHVFLMTRQIGDLGPPRFHSIVITDLKRTLPLSMWSSVLC